MADRPDISEVKAVFDAVPHVLHAPFTPEQVQSLNDFQNEAPLHPFTCNGGHLPKEHVHDHEVVLIAHEDGWHCPECDYVQDWCWPFQANGEWRT